GYFSGRGLYLPFSGFQESESSGTEDLKSTPFSYFILRILSRVMKSNTSSISSGYLELGYKGARGSEFCPET
ncbi:MAG: hypothetical protein AB7U72_13205, partial [Methanosarcina sp.]